MNRSSSATSTPWRPFPAGILGAAAAALDGAGLAWVVLRDPSDGEIDVLVEPGARDGAVEALQRCGLVRVPSWGRGSHRFLRGYDPERDQWWTVDLVDEVAFGPVQELRSPLAERLLQRRVRSGAWPRLEPDDAFWTLLLHGLLDKGADLGRHRERLQEDAINAGTRGPVPEFLSRLPGAPGAEELLAAACGGDARALARAAAGLRSSWAESQTLGVLVRRAVRSSLQGSTKVLVALRRRGTSVVLLGPDGAGKSTTAAALVDGYPSPARRLYGGHYGRALPLPDVVPGLALLARLGTQVGMELVAVAHRMRGRVVVHDRHAYDALVGSSTRHGRKTRIRRWLLARACVPPHLVVFLDAPAEELFRRSGEHSVAALDVQRTGYLELSRRLRHAIVLDTTRDGDAVRRDLTLALWSRQALLWGSLPPLAPPTRTEART